MEDKKPKMSKGERLSLQAFKNVQERKAAKPIPKLSPAMRAGLRAKIADRAKRDPEFAKRVDRMTKEAVERNKSETN